MDRLVALLNKYEKERKSGFTWRSIDSYDNCVYGVDSDGETEITMYSDLYSKHYGFIEWLVQNDKIDLEEYNNKSGLYTLKVVCGTDYFIYLKTNKVNSDFLLMLCSIQDNPISFLISILK